MRKKQRPRQKVTAGQRSGRLLLIRLTRHGVRIFERFWLCQCDCGKQVEGRESLLAAGTKKSCGCLEIENRFNNATHGASKGGRFTPEYTAWLNCRNRCHNSKNEHYKDYGGRGITVCPEWRNSFSQFLTDVGLRPSPRHSLDRYPNNDGNYEPGNVRWATPEQQQRNNRRNHLLTINGVTKCLVEWEEIAGLPRGTIAYRLSQKWSTKRLLTPRNPLKIESCIKGWETRRNAIELERPTVTNGL